MVFIESNRASETSALGDGFKVITENVKDVAYTGPNALAQPHKPYTIVGYGSLRGLVKLDPPRSKKSRYAIVVIDHIDKLENTLQMQAAEYVEHQDAEAAIACFTKLRALCRSVVPMGGMKRSHDLFAQFTESPKEMKKCRTITAMPSADSLEGEL